MICIKHYTRFKRYGTYERKTGHPNRIIMKESYAEIVLARGLRCLISTDDIDMIKDKVWGWSATNGVINQKTTNGKNRHVKIHRLIMGARIGQVIDHKNGEKLDNRRSNLRIVKQWENMINIKSRPLRNIYLNSSNNYFVQMRRNSVSFRKGTYKSLSEAISVRDDMAKKIHGDLRLR